MIHRAILGSIERFIGIIIEHFAGAFPLWLAPVQVSVLPLSEKFLDYGRETAAKIEQVEELNARSRKYNLPRASAPER